MDRIKTLQDKLKEFGSISPDSKSKSKLKESKVSKSPM